jgi:hypothetical protein
MYSFETLNIAGHRSQPVANTFFRQEKTDRIAIVLPGVGYVCQMPLLYYATQVALALSMDVLWVEYNYIRIAAYRALSDAEQKQWLFDDVTAACRAALDGRSYSEVALIGKSLGTVAMSHLMGSGTHLARSRDIWLTPVLRNKLVRTRLKERRNALVVLGTADPYYDRDYLAEIRTAGSHAVITVEGADHSMEIPEDVLKSLGVLDTVTRAIQDFLAGQ